MSRMGSQGAHASGIVRHITNSLHLTLNHPAALAPPPRAQSYYGEQKLHFLPADPAKADSACTVALPKEGPVHDVKVGQGATQAELVPRG